MSRSLPLLLIAPALLFSACAITRVDPPAPVAPPAQYKETGLWQRGSATADAATVPVPDAWWTLFADPVLDDLQQRLVIGNENLRASIAQVAGARAAVEASRSALFPTLSANASASRSRNGSSVSSEGFEVTRAPRNTASVGLSSSWEIDLWGRLAQASDAAQAGYQASADDLAAARLSAQAMLAQSYFSMRAAEAQQSLYERSVAAYRRSLELTRIRYEGGVAARTDVLQAETQLKTAQAQALEAGIARAQFEHAIAVLLGQAPSAFALARNDTLPAPPAVPEMLPGALLERRPDIAAAQRRVAAAYAQIGVADAAFFPQLVLSASAGWQRSGFADLISAPNLFWSIGPSITQAIFDGGQRRLASAQARASADQATATYRQTVLTALQEVEDNLVLADRLQQQAQLQQEALAAARRNLEITLDQYRAGTVSYLNVVLAQTSALGSENSLLDVRNRQLAAVNQLLKNIAGRWQPV
ncbi:MAG TPA: efflux transporter outer membrane subunit [Methylibium sp.]|uniref:efflux transporter outer membrane subunit n=1 Tax=Methylibium sp. TaxID=2067992 RepID=UPI002DC003CD|nr:efflux transporter outer membrane subunit [Methylibium sp.]HEU4458004.1 efflux transporter outer membrane subunit [Methylibium sp.]